MNTNLRLVNTLGVGKKEIRVYLLDSPMEKNIVGMVESDLFTSNVGLVLDSHEEDLEYNWAALFYGQQNTGFIMMEDEIYQGLKNNGNMEIMILLHELGHYFFEQFNKTADPGTKEQARLSAILDNQVYIEEIKADEFAADYIGPIKATEALEYLKQKTIDKYSNEQYDIDNIKITLKEIDLRIQNLQKQPEAE